MITAELDPVLRPEMADGMEAWVPNLRRTHLVRDCGHWTQQEKPEEVNRVLLEFLATCVWRARPSLLARTAAAPWRTRDGATERALQAPPRSVNRDA